MKKNIYFKKSVKWLSLLVLKYYCLISVYDLRLIIFMYFQALYLEEINFMCYFQKNKFNISTSSKIKK